MPRPWGLMQLQWATQQKCLWMCVLGKTLPQLNRQGFVSQSSQLSFGVFLKVPKHYFQNQRSQSKSLQSVHVQGNYYSSSKKDWMITMKLEQNIRDHRLVCAGTMKNEQLINSRHCVHFKPIPGPWFSKHMQWCRSGQHRIRNSLAMQGTEGQEGRGRVEEQNHSAQVHSDGANEWQSTHTEFNTRHILPRTVLNLIFLAKRKTKYQWLGGLKMHNEILSPWSLGYFDI